MAQRAAPGGCPLDRAFDPGGSWVTGPDRSLRFSGAGSGLIAAAFFTDPCDAKSSSTSSTPASGVSARISSTARAAFTWSCTAITTRAPLLREHPRGLQPSPPVRTSDHRRLTRQVRHRVAAECHTPILRHRPVAPAPARLPLVVGDGTSAGRGPVDDGRRLPPSSSNESVAPVAGVLRPGGCADLGVDRLQG